MTIYLDIETIPSQLESVKQQLNDDAQEQIKNLQAPKNYKNPELIAEWKEKESAEILADVENKYLKLSFEGATNHIVCIGIQIEGLIPMAFFGDGKDALVEEKLIIANAFDYLEKHTDGQPVFVGHNIVGFDLKVLRQRCIILGIKPPPFIPFNARPWDLSPFDTMAQWDAKNYTSLDKLAKAIGLEGKGEVTGKDVYPMWLEGKTKEISDYCLADIELTRKVYRRMNFLGE